MRPVVFLGPSLPLAQARAILDADYLPPVAMGDVHRQVERGRRVIAIVDGLFEQTPAVWHKEILHALSRGCRVLGASSMGALRAAELAAFGMEGVGEVFAAFHRGELEDDDEVAVVHASAEDGHRSLSDAMVSLRAGLRQARERGAIQGDTHDRLVAAAKALFYPDRSWPRLFQRAAELAVPAAELAALREHVAAHRPDVKRDDAIRLLHALAAGGQRDAADVDLGFDFEPTWFWEQLVLRERELPVADELEGGTSLAAVRRHVRLHPTREREVVAVALAMVLAEEHGARTGTAAQPSPEHALGDLARALPDAIARRLPAALAHLGRLDPVLADLRRKRAVLESLGLASSSAATAGIPRQDLVAWYEERFGSLAGVTLEAHAEAAGYASVDELLGEIALEYLLDRSPA